MCLIVGGELLWRSAVSAAGHALASSPTAGSGIVSLGSIPAVLPSPSPAVFSASCRDTAAAAHEGAARIWGDGNFFLSLNEQKINGDTTGRLIALARAADGKRQRQRPRERQRERQRDMEIEIEIDR